MLFISVMLAAGWVAMMIWFGILIHNGDNDRASYALALAVVISAFFSFYSRPKITLDRSPIIERTKDFLITLILNIVIAFISVYLVARIWGS